MEFTLQRVTRLTSFDEERRRRPALRYWLSRPAEERIAVEFLRRQFHGPDKMLAMIRPARVVTWNGKDVPDELRELPAGRYMVEAIDDAAPALSSDEEAGIEAALESYRQGRVVDAKRVRQLIDAALGR